MESGMVVLTFERDYSLTTSIARHDTVSYAVQDGLNFWLKWKLLRRNFLWYYFNPLQGGSNFWHCTKSCGVTIQGNLSWQHMEWLDFHLEFNMLGPHVGVRETVKSGQGVLPSRLELTYGFLLVMVRFCFRPVTQDEKYCNSTHFHVKPSLDIAMWTLQETGGQCISHQL